MTQIFLTALLGTAILGLNAAGALSNQNERSIEYLSILDKTWQRESTITPVEKIAVPNPERYTILLKANGKVQVRFDCNRGGGGNKISESKLSFSPLRSTRMACPPGTLDATFMKDLQRVSSFFVEKDNLYLELPYDSGTMKLDQHLKAISKSHLRRDLRCGSGTF